MTRSYAGWFCYCNLLIKESIVIFLRILKLWITHNVVNIQSSLSINTINIACLFFTLFFFSVLLCWSVEMDKYGQVVNFLIKIAAWPIFPLSSLTRFPMYGSAQLFYKTSYKEQVNSSVAEFSPGRLTVPWRNRWTRLQLVVQSCVRGRLWWPPRTGPRGPGTRDSRPLSMSGELIPWQTASLPASLHVRYSRYHQIQMNIILLCLCHIEGCLNL